jgi:cholesterol transport system auxiliary component
MRWTWPLAFLFGAGCVDLKSSYPDRKFYTVEAARSGPERAPAPGSVLRVRRFLASKMCDGAELVTRTGAATYDSDYYNVFFIPPALQVGEQTHWWLFASKLFEHVVGSGSSIPETHILEGNLVELHEDARNRAKPLGVIELQFMLVRVSVDPSQVLFQKIYRRELPMAKDDPESLVRALGEGLSGILSDLEGDLEKVNRSPK